MEKKLDLRIVKTHKALMDTFLELLEEKYFEDITVKELCDLAMVRRATFYKHFADKYDFSIFVVRELQYHFFEENGIDYSETRSKAFYIEVMRKSISFISQNEKLIRSVIQSNMSASLLDTLTDEIALNLRLKFKEDEEKGCELPAQSDILAHFFTGALMQVIKWWIMQKDRISEEQLLEQILSIINSSIQIN